MLLGTATADAPFSWTSLGLFGTVFFWQFPHTASIGWLYRKQYAANGTKVAATVDPSGRLSGLMAVLGALGLIAASLSLGTSSIHYRNYLAVALFLGLYHVVLAAIFLSRPCDANARALWRMSLIHLPFLLGMLWIITR